MCSVIVPSKSMVFITPPSRAMEGCQAYLARCEDRTYGLIQLTKEDCMNHVEKRKGKYLQSAIIKSDTERPLCGRGGLIKRLTSYYGQAPRGSDNAQDRQRAVMAACHRVTSTDKQPHPALCSGGPTSWCRHRAAETRRTAACSHVQVRVEAPHGF